MLEIIFTTWWHRARRSNIIHNSLMDAGVYALLCYIYVVLSYIVNLIFFGEFFDFLTINPRTQFVVLLTGLISLNLKS